MFDAKNADRELEKFLRGKGLHQRDLTLADGCEAFFDFYRDLRPRGCVFEQPAGGVDMLLFQWGTYDRRWDEDEHDWIEDKRFSFNLTRELNGEGFVDGGMRQLGLTFEFEPDDELWALGRGDQWCFHPSELPELREYVYLSAAFTTCSAHQILRTVIDFEIAG